MGSVGGWINGWKSWPSKTQARASSNGQRVTKVRNKDGENKKTGYEERGWRPTSEVWIEESSGYVIIIVKVASHRYNCLWCFIWQNRYSWDYLKIYIISLSFSLLHISEQPHAAIWLIFTTFKTTSTGFKFASLGWTPRCQLLLIALY